MDEIRLTKDVPFSELVSSFCLVGRGYFNAHSDEKYSDLLFIAVRALESYYFHSNHEK